MWSEEAVERLITMYKERPCLWDPQNKSFKSRQAKDESLKEIGRAMNMETVEVDRKINVLSGQFRKTHKKVSQLAASGYPTDEIEQSVWYRYRSLSFLKKRYTFEETSFTSSSTPISDEASSTSKEIDDLVTFTIKFPELAPKVNSGEASSTANRLDDITIEKRKGVKVIEEIDISSDDDETSNEVRVEYPDVTSNEETVEGDVTVFDKESDVSNINVTSTEVQSIPSSVKTRDECDIYGELLAMKLKKFDDRTRCTIMHDIDNLIFRACMDYH